MITNLMKQNLPRLSYFLYKMCFFFECIADNASELVIENGLNKTLVNYNLTEKLKLRRCYILQARLLILNEFIYDYCACF